MRRRWKMCCAVSFVAAGTLWSCTQGSPEVGTPAATDALSVADAGLIRDRLPPGLEVLTLTHLIGSTGGTVRLAGHALDVPAGAVAQPTLFTLRVVPNGFVEVEATALASGLLGRVVNVGQRGFERPVTLHLSYARAANVPADENRLVILRRRGGSRTAFEPMPGSVDTTRKVVTAELPHFAGYVLAVN